MGADGGSIRFGHGRQKVENCNFVFVGMRAIDAVGSHCSMVTNGYDVVVESIIDYGLRLHFL